MHINEVKFGKEYWLGEVVKVHEIAEYHFVEYIPRGKDAGVCFSIFINSESIGRTAHSLEAAMAYAVAWKYDGCNSQAAGYFMKMIGSEAHRDYIVHSTRTS